MSGSPLISTAALAGLIGAPDLRVLDASWHLDGRDARPDFEAGRIPGAVRFDLEAASDHASELPHMMPTAEAFARYAGDLGVARDDDIVVYDTVGLFSAARVWWMFRTMGARRVRVLDGGLPAWRAEGRALETGPASQPVPATFDALIEADRIVEVEGVTEALSGSAQVVDARGAPRFRGQAAEPRPGVRAGHMPGAISLPYPDILDGTGHIKRGAALEAAFTAAGVDLKRPVVTTCGSGVTAAILTLGLLELGAESRLYDGSWAEWGSHPELPVETA